MPPNETDATTKAQPRLLLVEDDESVGPIIKEFLGRGGYQVVLTVDLADTKQLPDFSFAGVISDYKLKYSTGCEVIEFLREKNPGIPAILISGYGARVAESCADRGIPDVHFLAKPFSPATILKKVGDVLAMAKSGRAEASA